MKDMQLANTAKRGQVHSLLTFYMLEAIIVLKGTSEGYLNITFIKIAYSAPPTLHIPTFYRDYTLHSGWSAPHTP